MRTLAVYHVAPERVALEETKLPPVTGDRLLIRTRYSAISPGTETLIFRGRFPPGEALDSTLPSLKGGFRYPFAYGYALVGEVIETGPDADAAWRGRQVFLFHPHQSHVVVASRDAHPIPEGIDAKAALFLPNMESALNFVMDAHPNYGETVMIFGQGVVGLLTTALLARFPLERLITADPLSARRRWSLALGATESLDPDGEESWQELREELFRDKSDGLDIAIELSGNMQVLDRAMALTGFGGKIIVGSWYGTSRAPIDLGGPFHRRRLQLISSQVSSLDPVLSGRWNKRRRIAKVWEAIARVRPERFITHRFPLRECQEAFALADGKRDNALQVIFEYD